MSASMALVALYLGTATRRSTSSGPRFEDWEKLMAKLLIVTHKPVKAWDRAALHLHEQGYQIVYVCPAAGEALPDVHDPDLAAAIFMGGYQCAYETDIYPYIRDERDWIASWIPKNKPLLGICLGSQMIAHELGAWTGAPDSGEQEYGYHEIFPTEAGAAEGFLPGVLKVTQAHCHEWALPPGGVLLASSARFAHQAYRIGETVYGFQFHPEVTGEILEEWLSEDWMPEGHPGAHSKDRQRQDRAACESAMDAWFRGFLDRWIVSGQRVVSAAQ